MMSYLLVEMQCLLCCICYRLSGLSANAHKLIYFFNWVPIYLCPQLCVQIYLVDQMMMMHGFDATKWPLAIDIASHIQERTPTSCAHWRCRNSGHLILKNHARGGSCAFDDYSIVKWNLSIFGVRSLERFWIVATFLFNCAMECLGCWNLMRWWFVPASGSIRL